MNQTTLIKASDVKKNWYIVDASGKTVGRLATQVAMILRGKNKVTFTPHINNGDHVIVINAEKAVFSGKKEERKTYFHHSGYPGGLKRSNPASKREKNPKEILERAIRLMLPKGVQGGNQFRALEVLVGGIEDQDPKMQKRIESLKPTVLEINTPKFNSEDGGNE